MGDGDIIITTVMVTLMTRVMVTLMTRVMVTLVQCYIKLDKLALVCVFASNTSSKWPG